MYSNLVPFEQIVQQVKDDTGIKNLQNLYPKIRRLVFRVERDIGYGANAVLKRIKYSTADKTLLYDGNHYKIRLPEDIIALEKVGMCCEGVCPGMYLIQGNWLFFNKGVSLTEFTLIYYTLLCDGNGNPVTTENHMEAVSAGVSYFLYKPLRFANKGHRATFKDLEYEYYDRIGEAKGDDVWPDTMEEWAAISATMKMSSMDARISLGMNKGFDAVPESVNTNTMEPGTGDSGDTTTNQIHSFQFSNLTDSIAQSDLITDQWLEANGTVHSEKEMLEGKPISFENVGRGGFAIKTTTPGKYVITDVLGNNLNNTVFDNVYDAVNDLDIYISKEYYAPSTIYFKFKIV